MVKTQDLENFADDIQQEHNLLQNFNKDPYNLTKDKTVAHHKLEGRKHKPGLYDAHE